MAQQQPELLPDQSAYQADPPPVPIMPPGPPIAAQQWYVQLPEGMQGPLAIEGVAALIAGGRIGAATYVWRPGLAQWCAAASLSEFATMRFANVPGFDAAGSKQWRIIRNAKQNMIALFIVFILFIVAIAVSVLAVIGGRNDQYMFMPGCLAYAAPMSAIFAAIYLPLRWRVIMSLPAAYKVLGLIGGFGLIAVMAFSLLSSVVLAGKL